MRLPAEPFSPMPFQGPVAFFYLTPQQQTEALAQQISEASLRKQKAIVLIPEYDQNDAKSSSGIPWLETRSNQPTDRMPTVEIMTGIDYSAMLSDFKTWCKPQEYAAAREGFSALLVWIEMTRATGQPEKLKAFIGDLSKFPNWTHAGVSVILSFDQNRVEPQTMLSLYELHPHVLLAQQIIQNPFFQPQGPAELNQRNDNFSARLPWIGESAERFPPLQDQFTRQQVLIDGAPYGMLLCDSAGKILSLNPSARSFLGYTQDDNLSNLFFTDIVTTLDCGDELQEFLDGKSTGSQDFFSLECRLSTRAGTQIPVEIKCKWYVDPAEGEPQLLCYFTDISHHYEIEDALRVSEQRYRFLVEYQGEGVVMIDTNGMINYINEAGARLLDSIPKNIIGQPVSSFIPETHKNILVEQLENRGIGISSSYELTLKTSAGNLREVLVTATPRHNSDGIYNGTLAIYRDITERKQLEEKLRYQSSHDPMTGLYNRAHFDEMIRHHDREISPQTSIIIVDVDGLKEVNDQDGHGAGDQLIRKVARLLTASFRTKDVLARIGGDEFAILLFDTDESQLHQAILRLRHNLEEVNNNLPFQEQISFSIGGATTNHNRDINQTLIMADLRMYRQKRRKKAAHGSQLLDEFGVA